MSTLLILCISLPFVHSVCNYTSGWFNENHPWNPQSNGNDIERFGVIRAKYPWIFEMTLWTGSFEIRPASHQPLTDETLLIATYTTIKDGFICHAVNGKQCVDYEIRFCLESNPCSISAFPPEESQVAGGIEVHPHSLPWHVSIQYDDQHICGGTLIDDRHVLTTARCFHQNLVPTAYSVVLGAHRLSDATQRVHVARFIFHPDYNRVTAANDIGIMRLRDSVPSSSPHIARACLPRSKHLGPKSHLLIVAGWRTVDNITWTVSETDELRQTMLTVNDECSNLYKRYNGQKQLCAGTEYSRLDLCQGDYGSGLFEKRKYDVDRWILTGMVSYGCERALDGYPGVYVRVSAYHDWIQQKIDQLNQEQ